MDGHSASSRRVQKEQQDRALERWQLVDSGLAWQVAHSGRTIVTTVEFEEMLSAAGTAFDVLLVGYVSRFARNLRTAVIARHDLHEAGAALLFCDERVLSSDEDAWELWAREAVEAEAYSRRLGRRVREGYEAKFRRYADPGGNAPLGFRRVNGFLVVDPDTRGRAVEVFEAYASGALSLPALEIKTGIDHEALKEMLRNPIYNGWVRRHRRSPDQQLRPAAWRDDPLIGDELWTRVQQVREERDTGGGRSTRRHVHMLAGRLRCVCGMRIRAEATTKSRRWTMRRYRHRDRCEAWTQDTRVASFFEDPITAQVEQMRLGKRLLTNLQRLATTSTLIVDVSSARRRQLERELEDLARQHARRRTTTEAYLAEHERLTTLIDGIRPTTATSPTVNPDIAIGSLCDTKEMWKEMDEEGRRELITALYERITVTSDGIVNVELTRCAATRSSTGAPRDCGFGAPGGV